ncbi:DUF2026 family protein [Polaromonas sp.]|uniref:DUF2026 family protein n=1 Tax=Polaromonas sp. TaxID=1869339 RepID=UPI00248A2C5A|nr:DUF2026 family protein [Polaromonas sp.]MDI1273748.1 DUF2026 family protein [Polaromonas sp.]
MTIKNKKPPLTFNQYQRLHNVIQSLALNWKNDVGRSCVFFSITGAALMHQHYSKNAKVICGSGAVMLDAKSDTVLSWFTLTEDGMLTTGPDAFHAWIECDGWLIDLMAPNYLEASIGARRTSIGIDPAAAPPAAVPPRKMFQKPVDKTTGSIDDMRKTGDCVFVPDRDVTAGIIDRAFEGTVLMDVLNIAAQWHRPLPNTMVPSITITDDLGKLTTINIIKRDLAGAW